MSNKKTRSAGPADEMFSYADGVLDADGNAYEYSNKEKLFIAEYLNDPRHVATNAAIAAGYAAGSSNASARVVASHLMAKPKIRAAIDRAFETLAMPKFEILYRLGRIAAGSIVDVLDENGELDLELAKDRGTDVLIKKIERRRDVIETKSETVDTPDGGEVFERNVIRETVKFEIHDPLRALELIGKNAKLFVDRVEATGKDGQPLQSAASVVLYIPDNGRDPNAGPGVAGSGETVPPANRITKTVKAKPKPKKKTRTL
jgi:phage terminase small subunit